MFTTLRVELQELAPSTWSDKMFICSKDEGNISKFGSCKDKDELINVVH
jgi:hypothetical protein